MMLKPIIGMLLRIGVPFALFSKIARNVYVEVASEDFGLRGKPANNSRVAMLTGLSRTRVRQELEQLAEPVGDDGDGDKVRPVSRVLLGWHTDPAYMTDSGRPSELTSDQFGALYTSYSGKVVPMTAMLKELLITGAVEMTNTGKIRVLTRSFVPQQTDPSALRRVAMAIRDLSETGLFNLFGADSNEKRFERFATNQLIPAGEAEAFRDFLNVEAQAFLERADNWLTEREVEDGDSEKIRLGVGVYQITPAKKKS